MKTHITFVLDSSGSMSKIEADTIGGFNSFLEEQREEAGEATVTLYEFNSSVDCVYQQYPVEEAPELDSKNYTPGGKTALHDALYTGMSNTGVHVNALASEERPENVIIVVLTDGKENASEITQERIREHVTYRREEHGWEFLFIGANQDAALTANKMGIGSDQSLNMVHNGEGAQAAYDSASANISEARKTGTTGGFDADDRRRQKEARDS